jgi:hypothetical protein
MRLSRFAGRFLSASLVLTVFTLVGCGSSSPRTYPAKGKVLFKGKGDVRRLAGHYVQVESTADPKLKGVGEVEADGTFNLGCFIDGKGLPGLPEGSYRAYLQPPDEDDEDRPRRPALVPTRYLNATTSGWQFNVVSGGNDFVLEIDTAKR